MPNDLAKCMTLTVRAPLGTRMDMLTPAQLRAARAFLGWTREMLAEQSGVPAITIKSFESGLTDPRLTTVHKLRRAVERAGLIVIDQDDEAGPGLRLKGKRKD
jgi:DNA-binding XRE family transcriptional regulator